MENKKVISVLVFGLIVWSCQFIEAAEMGTAFTYQGHLYDANYAADGLYDFRFEIYDSAEDGNQLLLSLDINDVDVIDGYFTTEIDFGGSPDNPDAVWLQIGVRPGDSNDPNAFVTLSPRQKVNPTPYAFYAMQSRGIFVDEEGNVGIGTISPSERLEVAGNSTITGDLTLSGDIDMGGNAITNVATVDGVDVSEHNTAETGVHGVGSGAIVGTTLAQTLTNKTISECTIDNSVVGGMTPASGAFTDIKVSRTDSQQAFFLENTSKTASNNPSPRLVFRAYDDSDIQQNLQIQFTTAGTGGNRLRFIKNVTELGSINDSGDIQADGNLNIDGTGTSDFAGSVTAAGDIWAGGGFKNTAGMWAQNDVYESQSNAAMTLLGSVSNDEIVMPYEGSVVGITVASNAGCLSGTLTVDATIDGTTTGLQAVLDGVNTNYDYSTQAKDIDMFTAGSRLGVDITTDALWGPTTADVVVTVIVEF